MRRNCCHISLAFILKVLNYLQAFVGISIILYSAWMLNQWNHRLPVFPPSAAPPDSSASLLLSSQLADVVSDATQLNFAADVVSGFDDGIGVVLNNFQLPAPWFIYSFMGVGMVLCCISCIGCIAAEAINGCCLCFYTLLVSALLLIEAGLVAFIVIDDRWERILPIDPTGELESLQSFVKANVSICKWVGITIVIVQALSLLLSFILRTLVSPSRSEFDYEDDYENARGRTREPLLSPHLGQTSGGRSDLWSSLVREKYGLNNSDKQGLLSQNASGSMKTK
ncbi:hypothetical protein SAY87_007494 [Trapa incisa]|uniref:Tetraspanin-18-like n=1 Tax=Trapa incisa TaxID=236973 RepID=A0AAN7KGK9_9MYRT|nr:hypothetical protein SAY87_007494 [Trapa incisa]